MSFFLQTLSDIFNAFILIVKGDDKATEYIQISHAHWLLSWLMMIMGCLFYLVFLPAAYISNIEQEFIPKDANFSDFKAANMFSLIFVLLAGYMIVYVLAKLLEAPETVHRYVVSQNWVFFISIVLLVPFSANLTNANSAFISLLIFLFMFILFFAYRALKITLGLNGLKAFMVLSVLLVFELMMDQIINGWFGLTIEAS